MTDLHEENRRLRAELARTEAFSRQQSERLFEVLSGAERAEIQEARGELRVRLTGGEFVAAAAGLLAEALREGNAENYVEWLVPHPELGPLTLTLQRQQGLRPGEKAAQAEQEAGRLRAERAELIETLMDLVSQDCPANKDGLLDSCALSSYADALRVLERCGRVDIVSEAGKMVRARWKE